MITIVDYGVGNIGAIVNMFDGIAVEYEGLAADHRRLGEQVRP